MKGMVFSIKRDYNKNSRNNFQREFSIKSFLNRYGVFVFYISVFIFGIIFGCVSYKKLDIGYIEKFDLLFLTNISDRLKLSAFSVFTTSLAANFIFIFIAFLLSFTAWGMIALPLLCAFKGYGLGVSTALLFSDYSVSGIAFMILLVLPGTALFLFAFLLALKESMIHSFNVLKMYFPSISDILLLRHLKPLFYHYFLALIFMIISAFFDMILWVLFANLFKF